MPSGEIQQRILVWIRNEDDASAVPAVSPVGSTLGDVLFAAKAGSTAPAIAGLHMDFGSVYEVPGGHGTMIRRCLTTYTAPMSALRRAILAGMLVGAGCAYEAQPPYRPYRNRAGYSEVLLAPSRFQVTYQGTPGMSDGAAAEYAKIRAAELAQRAGKPYLRVVALEMGGRVYNDYEPAWWATDSFMGEDGHHHYHQRLLREPYYDTYSVPVAVLTVELLDQPAAEAMGVQDILEQGIASGLVSPRDELPPSNK